MDRDREIPYLSDEELMALIDGIEQTPGEYVRAPEYMEERILAAVSEEERKENGGKVDEPSEHALTPEEKPPRAVPARVLSFAAKKRELRRYSIRVMASAAASIALLLTLPVVSELGQAPETTTGQEIAEDSGRLGRLFSSPQERAMEKSEARQERYQEDKSDWEEEKARRREDYIRKSEAREDGDLIGQLSEKAIAWFSTLGGDEKE